MPAKDFERLLALSEAIGMQRINQCQSCFITALAAQLTEYIDTHSLIENRILASQFRAKKELIAPIDFYIENGFYVFTSWFHLKRGNCCKNQCRHCPYGTFS